MVSITSCLQGVLVRRHPVNIKFRRTEVIKEVWGPVLDTRVFNIGVLLFMTDYFCCLEVLVLFPLDSLGAESKNFLNPVLPVQSYLLSLIRSDEMPGELQPHHDVDDQRYCQHQQDGNRCCTETHVGLRAERSFFTKNISFFRQLCRTSEAESGSPAVLSVWTSRLVWGCPALSWRRSGRSRGAAGIRESSGNYL